jgi:hypothetical protein
LERDEDAGEATVRAYFKTPHPIHDLGTLIGECVHNLRSALDQLAWQLAIVAGNDPPPKTTEFPIFLDREKFHALGKNGKPTRASGLFKMRSLDPDSQALIENMQPYHAGDSHPLWVLHELSKTDKHRFTLATALAVQWPMMSPPKVRDLLIVGEHAKLPPYEGGDTISTFQVQRTGPNPDLKVKPNFSLSVVFDKQGPAKGEGLFKTLLQLRDAVKLIVSTFRISRFGG